MAYLKYKQESLANAKVRARQPWCIGRNSLNRPPLRIVQQYQRNLYIVEKYFQCATIPSLTMRVYLHSFSRYCLPNKFELTDVQGHPRSMIVVPIESALCDFLLVINSNFGPILHRFWDTATYFKESTATLVDAFVTSRVDYCNAVYTMSTQTVIDRLQRVMNVAAQVVSDIRKFDRGLKAILHDELHWLDVPERIEYTLGVMVYRCLHGQAPCYLADHLIPASDAAPRRGRLRSANRNCLNLFN